MSYTRGIVKKIVVREPKEGQFGKFANYGIQLETPTHEMWINGVANEDKYKHEFLVKDANHTVIEEGMEIECMYDTNDKGYHDVDKKTLKVLSGNTQTTAAQEGAKVHEKIESTIKVNTDESLRAACVGHAVKSFDHLKEAQFKKETVLEIAEFYFNYCKKGL